jgi:dUTPase
MKGDKTLASELAVFERLLAALSDGKCAREVELDETERGTGGFGSTGVN